MNSQPIRFALGQVDVVPGKPKKNLERILSMIKEAKDKKVDIIAFPEMCITGYLVGDHFTRENFVENAMRFNEEMRKASEGIVLIYGNIFEDKEIIQRIGKNGWHPNEDGRSRKYNAAMIFQDGKAVNRVKSIQCLPEGVQPKTLLPNYRIFDDKRYFTSLRTVSEDFGIPLKELLQPFAVNIRGKKVLLGLENCEDLWCEDYRQDMGSMNPTKMLIENGAEYVINISASPWTLGKNKARDRRVEFLKRDCKDKFVPFLYVSCCGAQNNGKNIVTFDGGSTIYNSEGLPVVFSEKAYKPELIIVDEEDFRKKGRSRIEEKSKIAQKWDAVVRGIRHLEDLSGKPSRFVIGLSGGIDSALSAALLAEACGANNVLGVNMPTSLNSKNTKDAAKEIAQALKIYYEVIPIQDMTDLIVKKLNDSDPFGSGKKLRVPYDTGNVMARIRGADVLAGLSAKYGAFVVNNGNKVEVALGYCTMYGDMVGAIAPLADSTKTEVVEMAKYANERYGKIVVPVRLFPDRLWRFKGEDAIIPSAELEPDQIDPMKFGYHCALIEAFMDFKGNGKTDIMQKFLDGSLSSMVDNYMAGLVDQPKGIGYELMKRWGVTEPKAFLNDLDWFFGLESRTDFKRVQAPPIIMTSKRSYGYDERRSILNEEAYLQEAELVEMIMKMKEYKPC